MNYFDKWGRLHHKPCVNEEPAGNNGYIYSAYYHKAGGKLDFDKLKICFEECLYNGSFHRHPPSVDSIVPPSREEILGAAALGLLKPKHLDGWNFSPFQLPRFSLPKLVKQLWELRPKLRPYHEANGPHAVIKQRLVWEHRNYFWQNNLDQLYRFAFSVPLQDRAFLLECWGETKNLRYAFYKAVAWVDSKISTPKNGVQWLKYGGEERKKIMQAEFPEDHPLRQV